VFDASPNLGARVFGNEEQTMKLWLRFLRDESGPTAVEYAVMLALVIGSCIAAISFFGSNANGSWVDTKDRLSTAMNQ